MRLSAVLLPLLALAAAPAAAQEINAHARVGEALRQGCTVQQVHTPAGKMVQMRPIVRCAEPVAIARAAPVVPATAAN